MSSQSAGCICFRRSKSGVVVRRSWNPDSWIYFREDRGSAKLSGGKLNATDGQRRGRAKLKRLLHVGLIVGESSHGL